MIPVDGSDNSLKSFQWFIDNVMRSDDIVVFVHVIDPPVLNSISLTVGMKIPVDDWAKSIQAGLVFIFTNNQWVNQ